MPLKRVRRAAGGAGVFFTSLLRAPKQVGAIAPSSRFLANAMAAQLDARQSGWVVEIGPGSGAVTRGLLRHGVRPERLLLVERDRRCCAHLHKHFPGVRVVHGDVRKLGALLAEQHIPHVSAIVSSLPLLNFPEPLYTDAAAQMLDALEDGARLVQFTYGPQSPLRKALLVRAKTQGYKARRVWLNFPPASVWVYEK